jgi:hypothetical protein
MEASAATGRTVSLAIPAKPDYVVLARLALSAVCRLAPIVPEQVADLKLSITEAANYLMGGERRQSAREEDERASRLTFTYRITDDALQLEVSGDERPAVSEEERELSLALIKATIDEYELDGGTLRLTKRIVPVED